jgi:basic membrane protein A
MATAGQLANYHNAFADIYMGRFLVGVAAGLKLNEMIESGKITADQAKMGYVGAYTYAEVISGYTSFYLGAKSVCPSVTMDVTFTGSWYDETAEKAAAQSLIDGGCVLLSQHADSYGAPTACAEAGVPDVSYNLDTSDAGPDTYLASSRINWAPYFQYILDCKASGTAIDEDWCGTLEGGSVEVISISEANAAPGTIEKVAEVKAALLDGSIKVFDTATYTVGGETQTSYMANAIGGDFDPDTEAIVDGVFAESKFRSAPYFDVQIDGITLLDTAF